MWGKNMKFNKREGKEKGMNWLKGEVCKKCNGNKKQKNG